MACDQWNAPDNFEKKSNKNASNKTHMSHVNASMAKKETTDS